MRASPVARSVLALVLVLVAGPAHADVVELKDGRRVEGTFRGASPAIVAVEVGGRTMTFPFEEVRALYFGSAPAPQPTAPEPGPSGPAPAVPSTKDLPAPVDRPAVGEPPAHGPDASAALAALQALQAAVVKGPTYRDYASRVSESRATVETFVQNPAAPDDGLKAVMNAGIRLYALAADAWAVRLRKSGYEALANEPAADLCAALRDKMRGAREQGLLKATPQSQGIGVAAGLSQILACAGERVDEAARIMAPPVK